MEPNLSGNDFFKAVRAHYNETKDLTRAEKDERLISELAQNRAFKEFKRRVRNYLEVQRKRSRGVRQEESATMALYRKLTVEAVEETIEMFFSMVEQVDEHFNKDEK